MVGLVKFAIGLLPWETLFISVEVSGRCVSAGVMEKSVGTGVLGLIIKDDLDCSSETIMDGFELGLGKATISLLENPNAVETVGVDANVASIAYVDDSDRDNLDGIEVAESAPVIKDEN